MFRTLFLTLAFLGCAGHAETESTPAHGPITWTTDRGLEVTLEAPVEAAADLRLGQAFRGPESARFEAVTLDGEPIAGVEREDSADAEGHAVFVLRFSRPETLAASTVIGSRVVRTGDGSLVRPVRAWLTVDGVELALQQW